MLVSSQVRTIPNRLPVCQVTRIRRPRSARVSSKTSAVPSMSLYRERRAPSALFRVDVNGSHKDSSDPACVTRSRLRPPVRPALSATLSSV